MPQRRRLMVVPIESCATADPGPPARLFDMQSNRSSGAWQYTVTADGQRFLVIETEAARETTVAPPIVLVLNWAEGLKR